MKIAFCGLSFSGKSTVFKALVGKKVHPKTSASGKVHLSIGTLQLKDERLEKLGGMVKSEKVVYPQINLVDILYSSEPGAAKGIDTVHIKEFDALALVIAVFSAKNPVEDMASIETEFILADLQVVQNRIDKIKKEKKAQPKKDEDAELLLLERCRKTLEGETALRDLGLKPEELKILAGFQLLTLKPTIVIANVSEEQLNKKQWKEIEDKARAKKLAFLAFCAKLEAEIEDLPEAERPEFMRGMGLTGLTRDGCGQRGQGLADSSGNDGAGGGGRGAYGYAKRLYPGRGD
jgi:ribosome-binding ATPase YchF (GTP1/OBG family)